MSGPKSPFQSRICKYATAYSPAGDGRPVLRLHPGKVGVLQDQILLHRVDRPAGQAPEVKDVAVPAADGIVALQQVPGGPLEVGVVGFPAPLFGAGDDRPGGEGLKPHLLGAVPPVQPPDFVVVPLISAATRS